MAGPARGTMGQLSGAGRWALAGKLSGPTRRLDDLSPTVSSGNRCGAWAGVGCVECVDCVGCFVKFSPD